MADMALKGNVCTGVNYVHAIKVNNMMGKEINIVGRKSSGGLN